MWFIKLILLSSLAASAGSIPYNREVHLISRADHEIPPHCAINHHPNITDISSTSYAKYVRSVTLPSGTTYRYVFTSPRQKGMPYILFFHGWPSSSYDWRYQIEYFSTEGYGVIAPDLLGYGGTDKPADLEQYRYKLMSDEIVSLLGCEGIKEVIGVGHDFGSVLLSRLANFYPSTFIAYSFIDVGYIAPPALTLEDIEAINNATQAALGYAVFGYWLFFNKDEAAPILDNHVNLSCIPSSFQFARICLHGSSTLHSLSFTLPMKQSGKQILGQLAL
jgi:pimeloyl-ACP methyl ester carboxylesterase